jgi:hypothetical protein
LPEIGENWQNFCPKLAKIAEIRDHNIDSWYVRVSFMYVPTEWRFYLNLAGSELPLVSTETMTDILSQEPV